MKHVVRNAVTLLALIGGITVQAQQPPRPRPAQPLLDPQGNIREEGFLPSPPLAAADHKYADIDGKAMKTIVNDFVERAADELVGLLGSSYLTPAKAPDH